MGSRGPAPTPQSQLERRGSWRGKLGDESELLKAEMPDTPDWIRPRAQELWNELAPMLHNMGVLSKVDGYALARYCSILADWLYCQALIEKGGMFKLDNGELIEREFVKRSEKLANQLLRLEREFGMTPASRTAAARRAKENGYDDDETSAESSFMRLVGA